MAGILKSKVSTYEFTPAEVAKLIASDLGFTPNQVAVEFNVQDVSDDRMERSPRYAMTRITVNVKHD